MTVVLGIKTGEGHDSGAALLIERDESLACVALGEERLSRVKHDGSFPGLAIDACLRDAGVRLEDVPLVCIDSLGAHTPVSEHADIEQLDPRAFSADDQALFASASRARHVVVNHHLAHAASAFGVTQLPDAAVLIIDGSGTRFSLNKGERGLVAIGDTSAPDDFAMSHYGRAAETQTIFHATRSADGCAQYRRVESSRRSGIGHFYTFFSRHVLGFGISQEGKAMGLAAYGDPARARSLPAFPEEDFAGIDTPLLERCMAMGFRPPKRQGGISPTSDTYADIAWWMQETLARGVLSLARRALHITGSRNLCLAGGVALNVVANRLVRDTLRDEGTLDEMFVQPAASDAGTPLGAALYGYHRILERTRPFQRNLAYLGPSHDIAHAEAAALARGGVRVPDVTARVRDLLLDGKIVGWCRGRSEHGPRALGARSILCWPRPAWMKDHLNARVKHREMFRPFAPIIAEERAHEVFDCDFPVPFMLMNTMVKPEFRGRLPAVTHADGSGRLQTVSREHLPHLHALLEAVRARDGVGVLLNTSFNDAGEPIVETPAHAIDCFERTNLDALLIEDILITKEH